MSCNKPNKRLHHVGPKQFSRSNFALRPQIFDYLLPFYSLEEINSDAPCSCLGSCLWTKSLTREGLPLSWIFVPVRRPLACKRGTPCQISLSYSSIQQSADTSTCNLPRTAALHLLVNVYISQTCRQQEHSMRVATPPSLHPRLQWTANTFTTPPFLRPQIHRLLLHRGADPCRLRAHHADYADFSNPSRPLKIKL